MEFDNIFEMFADMKSHVSEKIVSSDNAIAWLFGWRCINTNKYWCIKVTNAQSSLNNPILSKKIRDEILEILITNEKRRNINKFLNESEELDKLIRLKAFW